MPIKQILNKGDINRRSQRIAVVGVPSLLLVLSQGVVSPDIFKAMVTVTATIAAFTPLARGGFFHNFKFSVINDEKIAISKAIFLLMTTLIASQFFSASLYFDGDSGQQRLSVWIFYTGISFVAFLSVAMVEMYFYDYRQRKLPWFGMILMVGVVVVVFFYVSGLPVFLGQFARIASQLAGASILSFVMFKTFRDRFFFGDGWGVFKEKSFWIGINVAVIVSFLAYIARAEVMSGGAEEKDILLANCLLIFGMLKLLLYKEIRSLERFYLKETPAILIEWFSVILLSLVVLVVSEVVTFSFMGSVDVAKVSMEWHLRAYFSLVSLSLTMLAGGKVLRLFERGIVPASLLTVLVFMGFGVSYFFPAWSLASVFLVYAFSHFFLSGRIVAQQNL